jgi:23S rRNA (uracil1939-C5)-methyltransferase
MSGQSQSGGPADPVTVHIRQLVAGGKGIGRLPDGRVVLVDGALPGEEVELGGLATGDRMATATASRIITRSPHRVTPPCPALAAGCGGCDLQHASAAGQLDMKVDLVTDALSHLGGLRTAEVVAGPVLPAWGYRTSLRAAVDDDGRGGLRAARSHRVVVPGHCGVAHPLVDEVLTAGRFPGAREVLIRVGAASGDRLVLVDPVGGRHADEVVAKATVPADVVVVGPGDGGTIREQVAGRWWQVSPHSFFQARPDGAACLAREVVAAVEGAGVPRSGRLLDAFGGVGLFAGVLRSSGWEGPMVLVERSASAVADARMNLADDDVAVVGTSFEDWETQACEVVVADPARAGLGADAAGIIASTGASAVVLVSCDAASLGRDAALLGSHGFVHQRSVVVDLFANTHHVEVVTAFVATP